MESLKRLSIFFEAGRLDTISVTLDQYWKMNGCHGQIRFSTKEVDSRFYLALNVKGVLWNLTLKETIGTYSFHHWKVESPTIIPEF